jgi:acetoin utilization deacetylase AcuC-like enzyme
MGADREGIRSHIVQGVWRFPFELFARHKGQEEQGIYFSRLITAFYSDCFEHPLPEGHRFPMAKYSLLAQQLRREAILDEKAWRLPQAASPSEALRVHEAEYVERLLEGKLSKAEIRQSGFPFDFQLVKRELIIAGASIGAAESALSSRACSFNLAGGTHHAGRSRPEGFCLLNDIAIAAAHALEHDWIQSALVIDLDVHQGNGTAEIFENDPRVFTFSMHGANNFPLRKARSDRDVALADGTKDHDYLQILEAELERILSAIKPDLAFFQSGVDVLETDALGKLSLSRAGCAQRDRTVFERLKERDIPVAVSMGGGYSPKLSDVLEAHVHTFREAAKLWA